MQEKTEFYAEKIQPMLEVITELCHNNEIPMIMAFCLEHEYLENGKVEMTLAGSVNLEAYIDPPQGMLVAASILNIPGFESNLDALKVTK